MLTVKKKSFHIELNTTRRWTPYLLPAFIFSLGAHLLFLSLFRMEAKVFKEPMLCAPVSVEAVFLSDRQTVGSAMERASMQPLFPSSPSTPYTPLLIEEMTPMEIAGIDYLEHTPFDLELEDDYR